MMTEKELDELYENVKEAREMELMEIDYKYIRESVADILNHFNSTEYPRMEQIIVVMNRKELEDEWGETSEFHGITVKKEMSELNKNEKEYFKKLLDKYFIAWKITEEKWGVTFKNNN